MRSHLGQGFPASNTKHWTLLWSQLSMGFFTVNEPTSALGNMMNCPFLSDHYSRRALWQTGPSMWPVFPYLLIMVTFLWYFLSGHLQPWVWWVCCCLFFKKTLSCSVPLFSFFWKSTKENRFSNLVTTFDTFIHFAVNLFWNDNTFFFYVDFLL